MMPSLDTFPVPLIHISETNSTNNYLQSLCSPNREVKPRHADGTA